jgi:hypothetical protein
MVRGTEGLRGEERKEGGGREAEDGKYLNM